MVSVRTQPLANLTCATARRLPSDEGDSISFRNILKVCAEADWVRLIGYCMKDKGLAHFLSVHGGLSAEFMNNAADAYTAEAARSSFTSDKGNLLSQP